MGRQQSTITIIYTVPDTDQLRHNPDYRELETSQDLIAEEFSSAVWAEVRKVAARPEFAGAVEVWP